MLSVEPWTSVTLTVGYIGWMEEKLGAGGRNVEFSIFGIFQVGIY